MKKLFVSVGVVLLLSTAMLSARTAGTVNGIRISVEEANNALKLLTNGKMTWNKLPDQGKRELLEMMAPSRLAAQRSKTYLNAKEKEKALSEYWMKREMQKIDISDKEAEEAYLKMVKIAKQTQSSPKIPPFSEAKNSIKRQLQEEQVVQRLMKNAKIKIN